MVHKAGFVNIIGHPNVGKSTLMNGLVGEKLSIITSKAQTTRHRIMGIINGKDFQIVYSDTPGVIKPWHKLHETMMKSIQTAFVDADVILFVTDIVENKRNSPESKDDKMLKRIKNTKIPVLILINKIDLTDQNKLEEMVTYWKSEVNDAEIIPISALKKFNIDVVFEKIIEKLPEAPPYFPKDQLTDRPERFFVSEIIREKIFQNYRKEVPYAVAVVVESFKEEEKIVRIRSEIMVDRESQKGIIIGHRGNALKKVGIQARKDIEEFLDKKVYLELFVKVSKDWRNKENQLRKYGY